MAYTHISLFVPVALMGLAFSLIPAVNVALVAYIVDQSRLGTAYALMTLIQQIGFFIMNLLIGKANDYAGAGLQNPGGYAWACGSSPSSDSLAWRSRLFFASAKLVRMAMGWKLLRLRRASHKWWL